MLDVLLNQIEKRRQEMIALAAQYGLNSEVVIEKSKELDKLLNEYQRKKANQKQSVL
ncbi:aspartyl-phosphate phosphatase Spo0E family protein [Virgibacillus sp. 179-BFC.A HS]|uniref:Aspartyl-phosphate phosphatase Spo0E family protein n=1 Tax=Tigheibacillus jepli TaxID=3035914 RepID=A0ABU5CL97_9BACI|nr:aspartyl-phosphate phosphatase Spo0E family protein [Virgibacillus sp. 179-BFC.A HS]MDY0407133.1 aspartyl-phosphate phosphatase Spo0E family protein [Virgibacillus sp. 179-BFC.A HS]